MAPLGRQLKNLKKRHVVCWNSLRRFFLCLFCQDQINITIWNLLRKICGKKGKNNQQKWEFQLAVWGKKQQIWKKSFQYHMTCQKCVLLQRFHEQRLFIRQEKIHLCFSSRWCPCSSDWIFRIIFFFSFNSCRFGQHCWTVLCDLQEPNPSKILFKKWAGIQEFPTRWQHCIRPLRHDNIVRLWNVYGWTKSRVSEANTFCRGACLLFRKV